MSQPGRYSAEMIASSVLGRDRWAVLRRHIEVAVKFALPRNGEFFTSDNFETHHFSGLVHTDCLRLPYPAVVLEFDSGAFSGGDRAAVMLATETESKIVVNVAFRDEQARHGWNVFPVDYLVERQPGAKLGGGVLELPEVETLVTTGVTPWPEADAASQKAYADVRAAVVRPLLAFIEILQCSNVRAEPVEVPASLAKKRARHGEPSFAYHVLTIPGATSDREHQGGTHASPRQHLRRGHIRRLDDRKIWVNACVVGRRENGELEKDYRVVAPC